MIKDTDYIIDMLTEKAKDTDFYKARYMEKIEEFTTFKSEINSLITLMRLDEMRVEDKLNDILILANMINEKYLAEDTECPF